MHSIVTLFRRCGFILFALAALGSSHEAAAQKPGPFELWVGHELVDCPSDPARLCYQVKSKQYEDWSVFEGSISNFAYREGVAYVVLVEVDPSIDDSTARRTRYKVVQVLEEFETFAEPEIADRMASSAAGPTETEITLEPAAADPPRSAAEPMVADPPPALPAPVEKPVAAPLPPPYRTAVVRGEPFRGILIIGSGTEARSFTPCGEDGEIWIEDESGAELWKVYRERVEAPNQPLLIDIHGEVGSPPLSGFGAHYDRQLRVFEIVRVDAKNTDCASMAVTSVTDTAAATVVERPTRPASSPAAETAQVLISGGPPTWTLSIGVDELVFASPATDEMVSLPYASLERSASRAVFAASLSGAQPHTLKVVIDREPCPDAVTGARRDLTAYVTLDGRWLRGCVTDGDPLSAP